MKEWCINSPFLTFWIIVIVAICLDNIIGNLLRAFAVKKK